MNFKELKAEIDKRDYENIEGLKAEITRTEFNNCLNALPPLDFLTFLTNWDTEKGSFYLNEPLTENLYYYFYQIENKFYCEIKRYNMSKEELIYYG